MKPFLGKTDSEKANTRRCTDLNDDEVKQFFEWYGLYQLLMMRMHITGEEYDRINDRLNVWFGHRVARHLKRENVDLVISYDNNSAIFRPERKSP